MKKFFGTSIDSAEIFIFDSNAETLFYSFNEMFLSRKQSSIEPSSNYSFVVFDKNEARLKLFSMFHNTTQGLEEKY